MTKTLYQQDNMKNLHFNKKKADYMIYLKAQKDVNRHFSREDT